VFQRELEAQLPEERAELQRERLRALLRRLLTLDSRYWRTKLRGIDEDAPLTELPFTVKSDLRDEYPFGTLARPLAETVRIHASSGTRGRPTIVA
jgi:phenylacetate-CoA ligase